MRSETSDVELASDGGGTDHCAFLSVYQGGVPANEGKGKLSMGAVVNRFEGI